MPKPIELFKPGTYGSRTFSEADLQEIVETYDPAVHHAPFVIGHPELDDPAWGWVNAIEVDQGHLQNPDYDIEPEFAELIDRKLYRKRSIALYDRDDPANPTPGKYYLKHVGWLGATPPKVKGLADLEFSESEKTILIEFSETMDTDEKTPPPEEKSPTSPSLADLLKKLVAESGMNWERLAKSLGADAAKFAAMLGEDAPKQEPPEFAEQRRALAQREAKILAREREVQRKDMLAFCEGLGGKLLPRQVDEMATFLQSLSEQPVELVFSEDRKQVPLVWFQDFLKGLPEQVRYGGVLPKPDGKPLNFAEDSKAVEAAIASKTAELKAQGITKTYAEIVDLVFAEVE